MRQKVAHFEPSVNTIVRVTATDSITHKEIEFHQPFNYIKINSYSPISEMRIEYA